MAILNHGSTLRTADGGQSTTTIVTASNIGSYAVASNATYYIGTTQNIFNRASAAQTLTGVSIDGNAATVTTNANLTGHITSVGNATSLGSFTSAQLLAALTDETGTGANVFATSPTLVSPILGTPTSGNLANCTFPTLNQNTTGSSASCTGNAATATALTSMNISQFTNNSAYLVSTFDSVGTVRSRTAVITYKDHAVGSPTDAAIRSLTNADDNWIYLDSANAQWGIYHRNIDTALVVVGEQTLPANSIAFIGNNSNKAYICLADGTAYFAGTITGSISGNAATVTTNANLTGHITSVGNATSLGSFTSAQLLAALTDETGTGANVFATSPTLVSPILGTPTSGNLANCTFPTLNQNTTGSSASCTGNAATVTNGVYTTGAQTIAGVKTFSDNLIANAKLEVSGTSGDSLPTFKIISTTAPNTFNYAGTILNSSLGASRNYVLFIGKASSTKNAAYIGYNHSGTDGSDTNFLTLGHYASDNLLNILGNGNVGIGTTSPANKLHVVGSAYSDTDFRAPIFYDSNDTGYFLNPNSTSNLNNLRAATISAANHGLTCVYYGGGATPTNGYLITTNIDYSTFNMPTVIIEGYAYGNGVPIHLEIVWYAYNNSWTNLSYTNLGAWNPGTVSIGTNANGKVCLHLSSLIYYGRFNVRCIYDQGNAPLEGWTVTDATTSALTRVTTISKVELATSITGNAATVTNGLYTSSTLTAGNLSGTIPSGVLGNSTHYVGTTAIALNRGSASQTLTGVSIDGNAATATNGLTTSNYVGYSAFTGSVSSGANITATGYVYASTYLQTAGNLIYPSTYGVTQRLEVSNAANNAWIDGLTIAPGGIVTAYGDSRAPIFYDNNNTAYYLDPAGTSVLNAITYSGLQFWQTDSVYAKGTPSYGYRFNNYSDSINAFIINNSGDTTSYSSSRAPIFYDSNNTAYYLDPASTSVLNALTIGGNTALTTASTLTAGNLSGTIPSGVLGNSTHYVGTTAIALNRASAGQTLTGISIDGNSGGIYAAGGAYIQTTSTGTSYGSHIQVREAAGGGGLTSEIYAPALGFHWAAVVASNILMESSGRIAIRDNPGTSYENFIANIVYGNASVRSPIFYDSNNTAYYVDPSSTGYSAYFAGAIQATKIGIEDVGLDCYMEITDANPVVYGVTYGGEFIFYGDKSTPASFLYYGGATVTYTLQANSSLRSPIFYDSDNTAYYIDGASGSRLKYLQIDGDWGSSPFGSGHESFTIRSTYPSMVQRQTNGSLGYWLHHVSSDGSYLLYGGRGATDGSSWDWSYRAYPNQDGSYVEFRTSARAPLFYDSNDTTYYVDAASTSRLNTLNVVGTVTAARGVFSNSSGSGSVIEAYNTVATNGTTAIVRQTTAGGNGNQDIGLLVDIQGANDFDRIANFRYYDGSTFTSRMAIMRGGNVGIGTINPTYKLQVNGSFAATTKSFDIPHPTKENKRLVYASLEGPENGVYVRGKNKCSTIYLPDYWTGLVHEDSITVSITSIGKTRQNKIRNYSVTNIEDNMIQIFTDSEDEVYDFNYIVYAERKDVAKLVVEKESE